MRNRLLLIAFFAAAALGFYIINHGAYHGYFQADSLDNIALDHAVGWGDIVKPMLLPTVPDQNFRPVGALFLRLLGNAAGLRFPAYIAAIHILHFLNALLVYFVLRKLGLPALAACAGSIFFLFHMALFGVLWEPMFVFDLLCGFFCLLSLLTYIDGHWIVSFVLFWLAYRSKENAIMLPLALAAWEFLIGPKIWRRLIPFFALSAILGIQALYNNSMRESAYTLHFDPASIWKCLSFYSSDLLLIPFAGFIIFAAFFFARNKRLFFGAIAFFALMLPMLVLPGRLFGAYLYVPLIAAAVCIGALADLQPKVALAVVVLLWVPWSYVSMRKLRGPELERAGIAHHYIDAVAKVARENPSVATFLYHEIPMEAYAISGAVSFLRGHADVNVLTVNDPEALKIMQTSTPLAILDYEPAPPFGSIVTAVRTAQTPDLSYIKMDRGTPVWQLASGWNLGNKGPFRWIAPDATARLARPDGAKQFELVVNVTNGYLKYEPHIHLRVLIDGRAIGERDFDSETIGPIRWNLDPAPAGPANISFEVRPGFRTDPKAEPMGLSIGNFGFLTQ